MIVSQSRQSSNVCVFVWCFPMLKVFIIQYGDGSGCGAGYFHLTRARAAKLHLCSTVAFND